MSDLKDLLNGNSSLLYKEYGIILTEREINILSEIGFLEVESCFITYVKQNITVFLKKFWEGEEIKLLLSGKRLYKEIEGTISCFYCKEGKTYQGKGELIFSDGPFKIEDVHINKLISDPGKNKLVKVNLHGKTVNAIAFYNQEKFEINIKV